MAATFGRLMVELRFQRKAARQELKRATGIAWNRLRYIEEGLRVPDIDELVRLAQFYGVDAAELFIRTRKGL